MKNIYPHEYEAEVHGRKKTLVQPLKQFQAQYYQLYEKGMSHTMVGLQGLYLGSAFRFPNISAGMGLKSFCPWCLKLGGNMEMITTHLHDNYQMAIVSDICHEFANMTTQNVLYHWLRCKVKHNKRVHSA